MNTFINDIKLGLRMLAKRPGFTLTAVLILALGIGANTTISNIMYRVLLTADGFPGGDRLVILEPQWNGGEPNGSSSGPDYLDWKERSTVFEALSASMHGMPNLTDINNPRALNGAYVTADYFQVMYPQMTLGRGFLEEETQHDNPYVAVLSHKLWKEHYRSDPAIIGRKIMVDRVPHEVVGVTSGNPFFEELEEIYLPFPSVILQKERGNHHFFILGRLKEDISIAEAKAEMKKIGDQLQREYPKTNDGKNVHVDSVKKRITSFIRPAFLILYGAVSILLIIVCVNVSNLLLVRTYARSHELAIRRALGSGSFRIIRQLLTESLLIGLAGGLGGLLLSYAGLNLLKIYAPKIQATGTQIPGLSEIGIDHTTFLFSLLLAIVCSLFFGLLPAWKSARSRTGTVLKETENNASAGRSRHFIFGALVVSQIALAFILLTATALITQSYIKLIQTSPGFNPGRLLAIQISRPLSEDANDRAADKVFFHSALTNLAKLPGVESTGSVSLRPMSPSNNNTGVKVVGKEERIHSEIRVVGGTYFHVMQIPVHLGRTFTEADQADSGFVVVVSQEFARHFPDQNPVGQVVKLLGKERTIIGVVGDIKGNSLAADDKPFIYIPHTQAHAQVMTLFVRTKTEPTMLMRSVRKVIQDLDPCQPILYTQTMNQIIGESLSMNRFCTTLITITTCIAVLIAMLGLYAVTAFAVNDRRNELGIRIALGATSRDVIILVSKRAILLTGIGLIIGLVGSFALSRLLGSLLFEIRTTDPATYILVPVFLFGIAMLANYLPARRAVKTDPMEVLRNE